MGWWIKSDGCDLVSGLMESVAHEWNGDVDMGDGAVQQQHAEYIQRLKNVDKLVLRGEDRVDLNCCLQAVLAQLEEDRMFIDSGTCMYYAYSFYPHSTHLPQCHNSLTLKSTS